MPAIELRQDEVGVYDYATAKERRERMWGKAARPSVFRPSSWKKPVTIPAPYSPEFESYGEKDRTFDDGVVGALSTVKGRVPPKPTMTWILQVVADAHGFAAFDLKRPSRNTLIVAAKHEFYWLARTYTLASFPAIARFMGGVDHTTALHGFNRIEGFRRNGTRALKAHDRVRAAYEQWARAVGQDVVASVSMGG